MKNRNCWFLIVRVIFPIFTFNGLMPSILPAQPDIQWQRTYGGTYMEEPRAAVKTADGGFGVIGYTGSPDGDISGYQGFYDFWLVKTNSIGALKWQKTLGGTYTDIGYGICNTAEGGFVVVGNTNSDDGDVTGYHGGKDIWIVKVDSEGNILWQRSVGGSSWDEARSVYATLDGGYIVAGSSNSDDGDACCNNLGSLDFWVIKFDASGEIEWQNKYGGTSEETARSIIQTQDGGYLLLGTTFSTDGDITDHHGNGDFWLLKLRTSGTIEWQKTLGGCCSEEGRKVIESEDAYFACGQAGSPDGDVSGHQGASDMWVVKLSKNGDIIWEKTLGGINYENGLSGYPTSDGGFISAGTTRSNDGHVTDFKGVEDVWIVRLKPDGNLLWQKTLGGTDGETCVDVLPTADGGIFIAGYTWSLDGDLSGLTLHGESDFWLIKLNAETSALSGPENPTFSFYPHPAGETINLQLPPDATLLSATLHPCAGQFEARTMPFEGTRLQTAGLLPGCYLLSLQLADGRRLTSPLIKM